MATQDHDFNLNVILKHLAELHRSTSDYYIPDKFSNISNCLNKPLALDPSVWRMQQLLNGSSWSPDRWAPWRDKISNQGYATSMQRALPINLAQRRRSQPAFIMIMIMKLVSVCGSLRNKFSCFVCSYEFIKLSIDFCSNKNFPYFESKQI